MFVFSIQHWYSKTDFNKNSRPSLSSLLWTLALIEEYNNFMQLTFCIGFWLQSESKMNTLQVPNAEKNLPLESE